MSRVNKAFKADPVLEKKVLGDANEVSEVIYDPTTFLFMSNTFLMIKTSCHIQFFHEFSTSHCTFEEFVFRMSTQETLSPL